VRADRGGAGRKWLSRFGRFWWDFVVGDDWLVALLAIPAVLWLPAAEIAARRLSR